MSKSIVKNSILSMIKTAVTLLFPFITFSYASRILLVDGMGKIEFSRSFITYFTLLAMLGVNNYGMRECARIRDDKAGLSKLVNEIMTVNVFSLVISYVILFLVIFNWKSLSGYRELLLINSLTVGLTVIGMEWLYSSVEDYKYVAIRTCLIQIVSLVLMLIFVKKYEDVDRYAAIQVLSNGGAFVMNFIHSRKYINWKTKVKLDVKKHIKPIMILFLMSAITTIFTAMDSTMLGFISGDKYVGLYSASHKISNIISSTVNAAVLVLAPRISYYAEKHMIDEIKKISITAMNYILLLGIPACIGLIMLSKQLVLICSGSNFIDADITSKIMAVRVLFVLLNTYIVLFLFVPLKEDKKNLCSVSVAAVLNLIVNFIMIPKLAQNGAAIGTIFAEGVELVINLFFLSRFMNLKPVFNKLWQYVLCSLIIIPVCLIISKFVSNIIISTLCCVLVSVVAYFVLMILIKNPYVNAMKNLINNKMKN